MTAGTLYVDYGSIDQVLEHLGRPALSNVGTTSHDDGRGDYWDLGMGYDDAVRAYTGGWAEGARRAQDLADTLAPRPRSTRTALRRNVTGAFPNVGAYLAGAPNAMYQVSRKAAQGRPYVHLYCPVGYNANVEASTAFEKGCAMVAVIDALEGAGCRVAVTLTCRIDVPGGRVCQRFDVKDYGDPLDIDQMIYTAAHPAFFRHLVFALRERSEHAILRECTRGGYGKTRDLTEADCPVDGNAVRVIVPTLRSDQSGTDAATFLRQMVALLPADLATEIDGES